MTRKLLSMSLIKNDNLLNSNLEPELSVYIFLGEKICYKKKKRSLKRKKKKKRNLLSI